MLQYEETIMKTLNQSEINAKVKAHLKSYQDDIDKADMSLEEAEKIMAHHEGISHKEQWALLMDENDDTYSRAMSRTTSQKLYDLEVDRDRSKIFSAKARYLIVDKGTSLLSPAGFSPTDNAWMLKPDPQVNIQSDRVPGNTSGLLVIDLEKTMENAA